jgi:hypothetical protein
MKDAEIEARQKTAEAEREARKKSVRVKIRLTEEEKNQWQGKAKSAGMTLSRLIRDSFDRVYVWSVGDRKLYAERTREIARIGSNINQLARWANTYKTAADAVQIIIGLAAVEKALKGIPSRPPQTDTEVDTEVDDNAH